jgi:hypothetical protein
LNQIGFGKQPYFELGRICDTLGDIIEDSIDSIEEEI